MGKIAGKSFYREKTAKDEQKLNELYKERGALVSALAEAEANGIEQGSADWIAMRNDIYSVDEAIADLTYELEDFKKKMKEVAKLNFDDLKSQFENTISIITGQTELTDAVVSMTQNAGYIASRTYYEALLQGSKENIKGLRKEYEKLSSTLADAMSAGDIEKYSEEWYQMNDDIMSVKKNLVDAANATIEYANALRQIDWDVFDKGIEAIDHLASESQFFIDLFSYADLFDKKSGEWTKGGIATRGLMVERYQTYMDQADAYAKEREEIKKLLEVDPKNNTLLERYSQLTDAQQQAILNAKKEKKAIEDLYQNGYNNLLDILKKLVDEYRNSLNAARDLYDYQKNIEKQTENISSLEKQIRAYSGGDTEENRATLQKLTAQLKEAQEELQETEYDRYIKDQGDLLDQFLSDLEEWFNNRIDESDNLFQQAVAATNENGKLIDSTLHEEANSVNYRMTDEFSNIWDKYSSEDGIASNTLNILTLTNDMTNSIRTKMDELPTEARLEEYFNSDELRLLQELTSVESNTSMTIAAIDETNRALDEIHSNIVEYSGVLSNKLDAVADAVNNLDLSVEVNVDAASGDYETSGGGGRGGGGTVSVDNTPKDTSKSNAINGYKVYNGHGELVATADTPVHASQKANAYVANLEKQYKTAMNKGMPTNELDKKKRMSIVPYAKGGLIGSKGSYLDSIARLLGEDHMVAAKEGERILTEEQNKNFEKMVNANFTPLEASLQNKYSLLSGGLMTHLPSSAISNIGGANIGNININLPNVTNKEEFVQWLKTDGQIEKIIQSMSIGRMMGGNSYNKMKY